jgi:hypothetical protein
MRYSPLAWPHMFRTWQAARTDQAERPTTMDDQRRKKPVTTADIASGAREGDPHREDPNLRGERRGHVGEPRDHRYEPGEERDRRFRRPDAGEPGAMHRASATHERGTGQGDEDEARVALLAEGEVRAMRERWMTIQTEFVDAPREAVAKADQLVAETIRRLAESFAQGRGDLERQWDRGDEVSTEDLRLALRRYRSFFDRLLSV